MYNQVTISILAVIGIHLSNDADNIDELQDVDVAAYTRLYVSSTCVQMASVLLISTDQHTCQLYVALMIHLEWYLHVLK